MKLHWRPPFTVSLLVLLLASGACDPSATVGPVESPTESPEAPAGETSQVTHSPRTSTIRVRNVDLAPRNYLLYEAKLAALVDPNLDPAGSHVWIVLEPGETVDVPLETIPGWKSDATAVYVYSWTKSVAYEVGGGTQWLGEGWETIRVEL